MQKLLFKVELLLNNKKFAAEGVSVFEALKAVHPHPDEGAIFFRTKGHLSVTAGKQKIEQHSLTPMQLKRIFNKIGNYTNMQILAGQLEKVLKTQK